MPPGPDFYCLLNISTDNERNQYGEDCMFLGETLYQIRFSFNLNAEFKKQPNILNTYCKDESQQKKARGTRNGGNANWVVIDLLSFETPEMYIAAKHDHRPNDFLHKFVDELVRP